MYQRNYQLMETLLLWHAYEHATEIMLKYRNCNDFIFEKIKWKETFGKEHVTTTIQGLKTIYNSIEWLKVRVSIQEKKLTEQLSAISSQKEKQYVGRKGMTLEVLWLSQWGYFLHCHFTQNGRCNFTSQDSVNTGMAEGSESTKFNFHLILIGKENKLSSYLSTFVSALKPKTFKRKTKYSTCISLSIKVTMHSKSM